MVVWHLLRHLFLDRFLHILNLHEVSAEEFEIGLAVNCTGAGTCTKLLADCRGCQLLTDLEGVARVATVGRRWQSPRSRSPNRLATIRTATLDIAAARLSVLKVSIVRVLELGEVVCGLLENNFSSRVFD